jgi:3-deoxy-D-manno-octulosonate 8-phosphate phosphatase (KDO 8-P phosphatase)
MKSLKNIKMVLLDVDGTLTDGGIYVHHDGTQSKRFHAHDGEGIRRTLEAGIEIGIISAASLAKDMIESRAKMLGIKYVHAFRSNKREVAEKWAEELDLSAYRKGHRIRLDVNESIERIRIQAQGAHITQAKDLVGVNGFTHRRNGGYTKGKGGWIQNTGEFIGNGGQNGRDFIQGGGFGQTGETDGGERGNQEGIRIVGNVEVGIVFGGVIALHIGSRIACFGNYRLT